MAVRLKIDALYCNLRDLCDLRGKKSCETCDKTQKTLNYETKPNIKTGSYIVYDLAL